jgi:cell division protein FtsQ
MDRRRRVARPPKRAAVADAVLGAAVLIARTLWNAADATRQAIVNSGIGQRVGAFVRRIVAIARYKPRHAGILASLVLIAVSAGYGIYKGDHAGEIVVFLKDTRDAAANAAGFRIETLAISGSKQLSDDEIMAAAGITRRTSLMFLDVDAVRRQLESTPWIAQATVRKLYPGQLQITLEERQAFALWQKEGKLSIIAADGTVLGQLGERRVPALPLVVGPGAAAKARDFLTVVERYPVIRDQLRASVLVAERRWNLKLKNGLDIWLPEAEVERALDVLVALDRDKKLLSRDLIAIDLRLPDRLTVRLSDEAAQAREQVQKDKKKRKGGDA